MEPQTERENLLKERIRVLSKIERSLAERPDAAAHIPLLAAVRELLMEAEAELHE
jgi:hypothetical protein